MLFKKINRIAKTLIQIKKMNKTKIKIKRMIMIMIMTKMMIKIRIMIMIHMTTIKLLMTIINKISKNKTPKLNLPKKSNNKL